MTIEFEGMLSDEIRMRHLKRQSVFLVILGLCMLIVFIVPPTIVFGIKGDVAFAKEMIVSCVVCVVFYLMILIPVPKTRLFKFGQRITITEETVTRVFTQGQVLVYSVPIKKIRKVYDYGDCYYLSLSLIGDPSDVWICQKDQIKQGTIEDFEKLFEKKIVRRLPKPKRKSNEEKENNEKDPS